MSEPEQHEPAAAWAGAAGPPPPPDLGDQVASAWRVTIAVNELGGSRHGRLVLSASLWACAASLAGESYDPTPLRRLAVELVAQLFAEQAEASLAAILKSMGEDVP